jgi:hypothetical protein
MFIPKKRWQALIKRINDLEEKAQDQQKEIGKKLNSKDLPKAMKEAK